MFRALAIAVLFTRLGCVALPPAVLRWTRLVRVPSVLLAPVHEQRVRRVAVLSLRPAAAAAPEVNAAVAVALERVGYAAGGLLPPFGGSVGARATAFAFGVSWGVGVLPPGGGTVGVRVSRPLGRSSSSSSNP